MGLSVAAVPALFLPLLAVHSWCFGFDHVIATFTRLAGLPEDRRKNRLLIYALPPLIFALILGLDRLAGIAALNTGYFVFQWFHTTRQSWGIAQHYRRAAGGIADDPPRRSELTLWSIPIAGLLWRAHQQPTTFLYMDLRLPPVPLGVVVAALAVSAVLVVSFFWQRLRTLRSGEGPHLLYCASHCVVFALAYLVIDDLHAGWLLVNVWHNVQYLGFVWMKNRQRFDSGVRPDAPILSWVCQPGATRAVLYFAGCLAISTPLFLGLYALTDLLSLTVLMAFTINFHHYIVDGVIWKRRPATTRA
jgi:hypothetical protein